MKIFITGSTGFIGSHIVRKLAKNSEHTITIYTRPTSFLGFLPKKNIRIAYGDIRNFNTLNQEAKGADMVIHNAAMVSDWGKRQDFYQTNVEGTRNILQAIRDNQIKTMIFTSTIGVLGEENCLLAKTESADYKPRINYCLGKVLESAMNHYRISKMIAEKETIDFAKENAINLTVVRPVWVYGPRDCHGWSYHLAKALSSGIPFIPVDKKVYFHLIYVEDLASLIDLLIKENLEGTNIFNAGNTIATRLGEYLQVLSSELKKNIPPSLPKWALQPLGLISEVAYRSINAKKSPLLNRARVEMFYCNNIYDTSKLIRRLNFTPSTGLREGIKKTVKWWRRNHLL
ncbi:NAD-dependent epimerase/dehydratase family protein [bacterium]|nr:MAG: NAD-dependent epimerase/dehydratase family protein [bacterium]